MHCDIAPKAVWETGTNRSFKPKDVASFPFSKDLTRARPGQNHLIVLGVSILTLTRDRSSVCYSLSSDLLDFLIWFPFSGIFVCLVKTTTIIAELCQEVWEVTLLFILKKVFSWNPLSPTLKSKAELTLRGNLFNGRSHVVDA